MRKLLRFIFTIEGWHGLLTSELVAPWFYPMLVAGMIGLSNAVTAAPIPLPYLLTSMTVAFAATAFGVLWVSEWRKRATVEGKLCHNGPRFNYMLSRDQNSNGEPVDMVKSVSMGFQVNNISDFSIVFRVDKLYAEADAKVPPQKTILGRTVEVGPQSSGWYVASPIEVNMPVTEFQMLGEIEYQVSYWRKGHKRTQRLGRKMRVLMARDHDKKPVGNVINEEEL